MREMIHRRVALWMFNWSVEVNRGRRSDVPAQVRMFIAVETRQAKNEVQRRHRDQQDGQAAPRSMTSIPGIT